MGLHIVILAAGQGTRMFSTLPKVLHPLAGKSMLERVISTANLLEPEAIHVIYGFEGEKIRQHIDNENIFWIEQKEQSGTGHALLQALPSIPDDAQVLVLYGDVPLVKVETLQSLIMLSEKNPSNNLTLLLADLPNPKGLGRIVRNADSNILSIVEEKDANEDQKRITEIYTGICFAAASDLGKWLPALTNSNVQKEYLLTDIIAMAVSEDIPVLSLTTHCKEEVQGVNDRLQLEMLERYFQKSEAEKLLIAGTSLSDSSRIDIRGELVCGKDVFIDVNCIFEGKVILGNHCKIGPFCHLKDVTLGDHTTLLSHSVLDGCETGSHCQIGPFARIRPKTKLASHCKIGNFVETKNATFGTHTKANHLSYLGDATLGSEVNVGAGTITCNYDGANKHETIIENNVHIGSDTQLVAPIHVGANATIGAGSTIRKDVPENGLTLTESKQKFVSTWKRPLKKT